MHWTMLGLLTLMGFLTMLSLSAEASAADKPEVVIDTSMGPITIELDPEHAPISVDNFLKYVDGGHYDGLIFHRVIDGFMIQGGGFDDQMIEKKSDLRAPIKNESTNGLSNKRGTIAMARTGIPDSATAQFYINTVDNSRGLDGRPGQPGYAVFGTVTSGMETADAIAKAPRGSKRGYDDVPIKPIYIKSIKRKAKS